MAFHCAPGFVFGVADVFKQTIDAFGRSRKTQSAPVPDELMREKNPLLSWNHAHQILFDLLGIVALVIGAMLDELRCGATHD